MSKNILRAICALITIISLTVLPWGTSLTAYAVSMGQKEIEKNIAEIIGFELQNAQAESVQALLDGKAAENAAGMYDWIVFSLMQNGGNYDFSAFAAALTANASADEKANAVVKERYALILSAFAGKEEYITNVLDTCTGELGIMSLIYALHIMNNGYTSAAHTTEDTLNELLALQNEDGGWGLNDSASMPDVTAMTLQAIAPYRNENEAVRNAADKALIALSKAQTDTGGFVVYGDENAESTAQVIIALCSLGISTDTDERFIKNGHTLSEALLSFSLGDGSFEHVKDKGFNLKATEQALLAFTALKRAAEGRSPLYILDTQSDISRDSADIPLSLILFAAGAIFLLPAVVLTKKKKKIANLFVIFTVLAVLAGVVLRLDIQKPERYYSVDETTGTEKTITVQMSVTCDTIKNHAAEKDYIPANGIILETTEISLPEDSTVYDCLVYAAKKYDLQTENKAATASAAYISGIQYIYEFDFGALSGWVYRVNGEQADVGCGEYKLADGDTIEWLYTCSLGNDLT